MENLDYAIKCLKEDIQYLTWQFECSLKAKMNTPELTKQYTDERKSLKAAIEILENYKQLNKLS